MSRRGNCLDNAVPERFFQRQKRERRKKKIDEMREESHRDVFDYIEMLITVSVAIVQVIRCHRLNMKTSILNGSKVPGLSGAIQNLVNAVFSTEKCSPCCFFTVRRYQMHHKTMPG